METFASKTHVSPHNLTSLHRDVSLGHSQGRVALGASSSWWHRGVMHLAIKVILDVMDYGIMCLLEPGSLLDAAENGAQDYMFPLL